MNNDYIIKRRELIDKELDRVERQYTPIIANLTRYHINSYIANVGGDNWINTRIKRYNEVKKNE